MHVLALIGLVSGLGANEMRPISNQRSLFDGKSLSGWSMDVPALDGNPSGTKPFVVRDGLLVSLGNPGGHLLTDNEYSNYRVTLEYRFVKPGNCGILVHASHLRRLYEMFPQSIEVQMMHRNAGDFWLIGEDITVYDMVKRRGPRDRWGYDGDKLRRIPNLTDNSEKPLGEWNTLVAECYKTQVKVWVNGDLVNYGFGASASKGKIALQSEGAEVEVRKFLIGDLR